MKLEEPLDDLFARGSHIRVLRALDVHSRLEAVAVARREHLVAS